MNTILEDTQTAVTSLGGAIAGVGSDAIADQIIYYAGLAPSGGGLGDVGLRFVIRSAVTSVIFGAVVSYMPETSSNVFFSQVYFAGNRKLVLDGVMFARILIDGGMSATRGATASVSPKSSGCSCK